MLLVDIEVPLVFVEGEFKAIASNRLAWHVTSDAAERPAFLAIALSGVWNWRGVVGKTVSSDGSRVDLKEPIPDLARLVLKDRPATIVFDAGCECGPSAYPAIDGPVDLQDQTFAGRWDSRHSIYWLNHVTVPR